MLRFDTHTYYTEEQLRTQGIDGRALASAVRDGTLRSRVVGKQRLFKGQWIIDWLDSRPRGEGSPAK